MGPGNSTSEWTSPCSCNISATPWVAQTWFPPLRKPGRTSGIDVGVCEQIGPENCILLRSPVPLHNSDISPVSSLVVFSLTL